MITLVADGGSEAERKGSGVEGMGVGSALRVLEDSEVPVVWVLLSGARLWPAGWSVLFKLVIGIEPSEETAGAFLSSDCRVIVLLSIPPFPLFTTPPKDGLP